MAWQFPHDHIQYNSRKIPLPSIDGPRLQRVKGRCAYHNPPENTSAGTHVTLTFLPQCHLGLHVPSTKLAKLRWSFIYLTYSQTSTEISDISSQLVTPIQIFNYLYHFNQLESQICSLDRAYHDFPFIDSLSVDTRLNIFHGHVESKPKTGTNRVGVVCTCLDNLKWRCTTHQWQKRVINIGRKL
jgi:hypothetical protein